uniref:Uncharacterized protein n=1 Tax=Glossina palpalis gambiensis TaxID=67801 RepID=A0A1B0BEJ5_9MUSC
MLVCKNWTIEVSLILLLQNFVSAKCIQDVFLSTFRLCGGCTIVTATNVTKTNRVTNKCTLHLRNRVLKRVHHAPSRRSANLRGKKWAPPIYGSIRATTDPKVLYPHLYAFGSTPHTLDDEDSPKKLLTLATYVPVAIFKNFQTENLESDDD